MTAVPDSISYHSGSVNAGTQAGPVDSVHTAGPSNTTPTSTSALGRGTMEPPHAPTVGPSNNINTSASALGPRNMVASDAPMDDAEDTLGIERSGLAGRSQAPQGVVNKKRRTNDGTGKALTTSPPDLVMDDADDTTDCDVSQRKTQAAQLRMYSRQRRSTAKAAFVKPDFWSPNPRENVIRPVDNAGAISATLLDNRIPVSHLVNPAPRKPAIYGGDRSIAGKRVVRKGESETG